MALLRVVYVTDIAPGTFYLMKKQDNGELFVIWAQRLTEANVPRHLEWDFLAINPADANLAHSPIQP